MCLLQTNRTADNGFREMGKNDQLRWEKKLFHFAAIDNPTCTEGLATHADLVHDWATDPILSAVRKFRCGRHRCYITGKNTDCKYLVCYILVSKRNEDDKPQSGRFKNKIINALCDTEVTRTLPPPLDEAEDEAEE